MTVVILSFCLSGCCYFFSNVKRLPEGGERPICPCFSLAKKPYHLIEGDLIDTNAIYISRVKNIMPNIKIDSLYKFIRFFQNGRFCGNAGPLDHFPDDDDINNLNSCFIGYYKLDGINVVIETFSDLDGGAFTKRVGKIENNVIKFARYRDYYKVIDSEFRFWAKPDW
jgi:hypothetical protein